MVLLITWIGVAFSIASVACIVAGIYFLRKRRTGITAITALLLILCFRGMYVYLVAPPHLTYHGREYTNPGTIALERLESESRLTLTPTGERLHTLQVLGMKGQRNAHFVTTVLVLKKSNQACVTYQLEGGP